MSRVMQKEDFLACIKFAENGAFDQFKRYGEVYPVVLGFKMKDNHTFADIASLDATEFMNTETHPNGKDILNVIMSQVIQHGMFDITLLICEAWIVAVDQKAGMPDVKPSEHPDKKECVLFNFRSADYQNMAIYEIDREKQALIPREIIWESQIGGRLTRPQSQAH